MDKQDKRLILRIDEELKNKFKEKSDKNHMTISSRLKYLMQKDTEDKIIII